MDEYYETTHANVHRGVYAIAEEADRRFEAARHDGGPLHRRPDPAREVVFTKNATEAHQPGRPHLGPGQPRPRRRVVLTEMEHHANIVPWLMLADERGLELRWIPIDDDGRLTSTSSTGSSTGLEAGRAAPACPTCSGRSPPFAEIADAAHAAGALVVADGAQSVPHLPTDVASLGCRLPRLQRPQDARPDRHRRAVGPRGAARGACRRSSAAAR